MIGNRKSVVALLVIGLAVAVARPSRAASWKTGVSYGANTTMDLYVPDQPAASPPIVVALHYCGGNASSAHDWLKSAADKFGFVIIAPGAGGNCFDASPMRSGERANIVKMVQYVVTQNSADATRVFSVGASSGACMTQALLAAYPEVFAAGSSLAGVPAGSWTGGNAYGFSPASASDGKALGDKVRAASKDFTGMRPRVQLWHGMGDTNLTYSQTYPAEVAQWTNVFGVTDADGTKESIKPAGAQDTWARTSYKDASGTVVVEANSGPSNVPHDLSGRGLWNDVVRFFGLDGTTPGGGGGASGGGAGGRASGAGGRAAGGTTGNPDGGAPDGGASGGANGSGGAVSTGGATGSGGAGSGGASASGGLIGSGGMTIASGGVTGSSSGGKSGSGGAFGSGGSGSGGSASGSGGATTGSTGGSGGCSLIANGGDPESALATMLMALVGMLVVRRQARSRR